MNYLNKLLSRKLLAWVVATALLAGGVLPPEYWTAITAMYLGAQGLLDHQAARILDAA